MNGRHKDFADIVRMYQQLLYWYIRRVAIVHEDAEDILQETFMKTIHMAAVRIADRIGVEEPARSEFIQLYQEFKKESAAVLTVKPAATGNTENDIEAKIYADFEKSEKILSLRKAYYEKFRTILTPSQIQAMYDIEKEYNARR